MVTSISFCYIICYRKLCPFHLLNQPIFFICRKFLYKFLNVLPKCPCHLIYPQILKCTCLRLYLLIFHFLIFYFLPYSISCVACRTSSIVVWPLTTALKPSYLRVLKPSFIEADNIVPTSFFSMISLLTVSFITRTSKIPRRPLSPVPLHTLHPSPLYKVNGLSVTRMPRSLSISGEG